MQTRDEFFSFLESSHLYAIAVAFLVITAGIVVAIYVSLYLNKKKFRRRSAIIRHLNSWITEIIIEDECTLTIDQVPPRLQRRFRQPFYRQLLIDQLILTKKNVTGTAAEHIVSIYKLLNLREDSLTKLRNRDDNTCARGIYELYMMDQFDMLPRIFRLTKHRIPVIRDEAQVATTGFIGARALSFLRYLDHPLSDWQQLKLLDRLQHHSVITLDALPKWLQSDNADVVRFALKLAGLYQQFSFHDDVAKCLQRKSTRTRKQAYETLTAIANSNTAGIMQQRFWHEPKEIQLAILKHLAVIDSEISSSFMQQVLATKDPLLQLEASRALAAQTRGYEDLLISSGVPETIVEQVQYERSL